MNPCGCSTRVPACQSADRRARLLGNPDWNGIDFVEVSDDQLRICVHMFGRVPDGLGPGNVRICGGRRVRDIRVTGVEIHHADDPELDDCLDVSVDRPGDFSTYCLCIGEPAPRRLDPCGNRLDQAGDEWVPLPGFDPRYACIEFTFKAACPSPLDCLDAAPCPPAPAEAPAIDYLARDYQTFRQLLLDRLAVTLPDWRERHVPDIGITLVELLAYAADRLSYYQDAVATEAYLRTARRRISVRRHARLIDYRLHEGCSARAWVVVSAEAKGQVDLSSIAFCTRPEPQAASLQPEELDQLPSGACVVFEPLWPPRETFVDVFPAQDEIAFHTWGDHECCLPKGATRATLVDVPQPAPGPEVAAHGNQPGGAADGRIGGLGLRTGDVLIFEEIVGPTTGNPADADPAHRHAVRLTRVRASRDELLDVAVVEIEWAAEDALPFPLCLSSRTADCLRVDRVSVARGNAILVDHGRSRSDDGWTVPGVDVAGPCGCEGSVRDVRQVPSRFDLTLPRSPVAFREPVPADAPASAMMRQDPRAAQPVVVLSGTLDDPRGAGPERWEPRLDLLASSADDNGFVVEVDDASTAHLRFGDGSAGRRPLVGTRFAARYRVGNGAAGNVGADTITCVVARGIAALQVRNPLRAEGGTEPEPLAEAKLFAPGTIRHRLLRAVVADDYAALADSYPGVQGAAATMKWTGSWYEAAVALDTLDLFDPSGEVALVEAGLEPVRRIGHDLQVGLASAVPLVVELTVCVEDGYLAAHVRASLRARLGARRQPDGSPGFFHADNLQIGAPVAVSRLVATAQSVAGVRHVEVTRLERFPGRPGPPDRQAIDAGELTLGADEVAQVDDDPSFPEHGTLTLVMRGGR